MPERSVKQREMTPREIVAELDRHIIGQDDAKRAVAIAIRNRWRRQQLSDEMRHEVAPKNIMMIGPTGVGKTEIARRLAQLTRAPFIKVEATKYTEVGYYGRDVESMVRELVENAIGLIREAERKNVEAEARRRAEQRILDLLAPPPVSYDVTADTLDGTPSPEHYERTREKMRAMLASGELDERRVELTAVVHPRHDAGFIYPHVFQPAVTVEVVGIDGDRDHLKGLLVGSVLHAVYLDLTSHFADLLGGGIWRYKTISNARSAL